MEQYPKTINPKEINQFSKIATEWWDDNGPFKPLHQMNPVRLRFIKDQLCHHFNLNPKILQPFLGLRILDIGCGGGILAEPLARLGATVTGIDASPAAIEIAKIHGRSMGLDIRYLHMGIEDLQKSGEIFDAIISLEVIEHVANVDQFLKISRELITENGAIILSTLNRTPQSYLGAIIMAEYILKWIPKGTHHWNQFIKPSALVKILETHRLKAQKISGMTLNPFNKTWILSQNVSINYILFAITSGENYKN